MQIYSQMDRLRHRACQEALCVNKHASLKFLFIQPINYFSSVMFWHQNQKVCFLNWPTMIGPIRSSLVLFQKQHCFTCNGKMGFETY